MDVNNEKLRAQRALLNDEVTMSAALARRIAAKRKRIAEMKRQLQAAEESAAYFDSAEVRKAGGHSALADAQ